MRRHPPSRTPISRQPSPVAPAPVVQSPAAPSGRSDGDARGRLLAAGLRLFAERGFKATSVRDLANEAGVNVAAISYHFGDKAALYRELFRARAGLPVADDPTDLPVRPLDQALRNFYRDFLEPLKRDHETALMIKLHYRELFEPTGAWQQVVEQQLRPRFSELTRLLLRELGLGRVDRDVHRAAVAMIGMAVHLFTCQDEIRYLAPGVLGGSRSIDALSERLADYGCAIVEAERIRRQRKTKQSNAPAKTVQARRAARQPARK
ncbi:MAG TPA: CerR family C-terminal domain-containing protein [Burkholderiaceae bacterium]|nr:CerR family C-terminal domain-containing protein [Burkholderiaceae bacterium]